MEKRKCTNCAFCEKISYGIGYVPKEQWSGEIRCWHEPGVCDNAFVISLKEAEEHSCPSHRFKEENEAELYQKAVYDLAYFKKRIADLERDYPELKNKK